MLQYDLIIIGGGASGLSAGVTALKNGIKKILILDRNDDLGGNLNLFIHRGFGEYYLNESVTGPELASKLINDYILLGGEYKKESQVLDLNDEKIITFVNPQNGIQSICGKAIIIASGCREKYTGNIIVPIHKYTGIFTVASAHKLVNFQGYLPGKEVIIVGKNRWSLLLARRLVIEGATIKAVIDNSTNGFIAKEDKQLIEGFNIRIIENSNIIELSGKDRIESVGIQKYDDESFEEISCDSLILTVGYHPQTQFIKGSKIKISQADELQVEDYKTSIEGIFACGTVVNGESGLETSGKYGEEAGIVAANYLKIEN